MIRELRLQDLGVIADATIEFADGLTAITGETGAGKTMLLTGLGLLLGGRADPATVRPGARLAAVEGRLVPTQIAADIADNAGALLDDGELVVVRTVAAEGRSRAYLGGRSAPMGLLAEIGAELVAVHGQSDQVRLRAPAQQRAALDAYAGPAQSEALAQLEHAHRRHRELAAELEQWDTSAAEREVELRRLEEALQRIDAVQPEAGELATLREEADRLGNVEELLLAATSARAALDGDGTSGALIALEQARKSLEGGGAHDPLLQSLAMRVGEAVHIVNDVATETGSYASSLEADPNRLEAVHTRRAALTDLVRNYGTRDSHDRDDTTENASDPLIPVLDLAAYARQRIADLTTPGAGRDRLEEQWDKARADVEAGAAVVSTNRTKAARDLAREVDDELAGLSMPGAHLHVSLAQRESIGVHGAEDVEFHLQAYPGAPTRPIAKAASGGELSRIMLAVEVALAGKRAVSGQLPVFVFDEVDAGVGGRAATEVGRRLAALAEHTQVIVVTHLAQVAAFADTQLVVSKATDADSATTHVHAVAGTERESELARMLSGDDSMTARAHAAELLKRPLAR